MCTLPFLCSCALLCLRLKLYTPASVWSLSLKPLSASVWSLSLKPLRFRASSPLDLLASEL